MKRTPLNPISRKRSAQLADYSMLIHTLRKDCYNRSELSGKNPDWQSDWMVEPHHIDHRNGDRLTDPFNIILITRHEHDVQEGKIKGEPPIPSAVLVDIVRPLRIRQGFKPAGY